ncbi:MAG: hypothetical protein L0312_16290, partial [Acidobacteria bacterium]|nr:hypothetical protein [Acidobacteriota bacterium]
MKWLPDCSVPLAKRAVDDLVRLCKAAREAAAVLERNPDLVPLPGSLDPDSLLSMWDLRQILPLKRRSSLWRFLHENLEVRPAKRVKLRRAGTPAPLYRAGDIQQALLKRRGPLEVLRFSGGKSQMLSESLCVAFQNQFDPRQPTFTFLPELIGYEQVSGALDCRNRRNTLFFRHGFMQRDGSPMRINTHAFRHWLNTLADQGGLSDVDLARWMGRRQIEQNQAYKHGTVEQRVAWAQEMLAAGDLHGPTASAYYGIQDPVAKQEFLQTFVNVVHFTPYGVCTHDFALTPCQYHLNCLSGCSEYLRTKKDPEERQNLIQLRDFTTRELSKAEQAFQGGVCGASNWVDFNQRTLAGIEAALAVDEDDDSTAAVTLAVFADRHSLGKPIDWRHDLR